MGGTIPYEKECMAPKKDKNKNNAANGAANEIQDKLLFSVESPINSWILDSGASFHTTHHREIIENYVAGNYGKLYMDYGEPLNVGGIRDISLKISNETVWIYKSDTWNKVEWNLISMGQLDGDGIMSPFVMVHGRLQMFYDCCMWQY